MPPGQAAEAEEELRFARAQLERQAAEAAAGVEAERQLADEAVEKVQREAARREAAAAAAADARWSAAQKAWEEESAVLQRQLGKAAADSSELEGRLTAATTDREELARQLAAATAALSVAEESAAAQAASAAEAVKGQTAELEAVSEQQAANLQAATAELHAALARLHSAEDQLARLQEQLRLAEERQTELQQVEEQQAAAGSDVLARRDSTAQQLQRLQSEVADAELLLASALGFGGSTCSSSFDTPIASPHRPAAPPEPSHGGTAGSDGGVAPEVATAVAWLQQAQAAAAMAECSSAAPQLTARPLAGSSRLCRRIQAVLGELHRLQQVAARRGSASGSHAGSREETPAASDSAGGSLSAEAAEKDADAAVQGQEAAAKLPLLSPVHSAGSSSLIPAFHGSGAADAGELTGHTPDGHLAKASSLQNLASPCCCSDAACTRDMRSPCQGLHACLPSMLLRSNAGDRRRHTAAAFRLWQHDPQKPAGWRRIWQATESAEAAGQLARRGRPQLKHARQHAEAAWRRIA